MMAVDMVDAVLRVVFLDEDRALRPDRAGADRLHDAAQCEVVVGLLGGGDRVAGRVARRVVAHHPHDGQRRHRAACHLRGELRQPVIDAVLVRLHQVERREVRVEDRGHRRHGRGLDIGGRRNRGRVGTLFAALDP
jgi:hypothetical protein